MIVDGPSRGSRRIRLELALRPRSVRVVAMDLLPGPAVQRRALEGAWIVQVMVDDQVVLLEACDDPYTERAASRPGIPGHAYPTDPDPGLVVEVPLGDDAAPQAIEVQVYDRAAAPDRVIGPTEVQERLRRLEGGVRLHARLGIAELAAHPDWPRLKLPVPLGLVASTATYEIYVDRAGRYRWRLRRPGGAIVADSGQGYVSRADCESDLRWIREHGARAEVRSLDLP